MISRRWNLITVCCLALAAAACDQEEIQVYKIPPLAVESRPIVDQQMAAPDGFHGDEPISGPQRIVAAVTAFDNRLWFFKMSGPAAAVAAHRPDFIAFMQSVNFGADSTGAAKLTWKTPPTWVHEGPSGMRYAAFHIGSGADEVHLTIIPLGQEAGDLLANINRWRGQLSQPPIDDQAIGRYVTPFDLADSKPALLIDLASDDAPALSAAQAANPPVPQSMTPQEPQEPLIHFDTPAGWQQQPVAAGGMRIAAFNISRDSQAAELTITTLAGDGGGELPNINRWRGQVGLGQITAEQLANESRLIDVDGVPSRFVDLSGPQNAGMLAVIVPRQGRTWFIKMSGPADLLAAERSSFEAFVRSIRFAADDGENDG